MFILRIILILVMINQASCRPTGFSALNDLINNSHQEQKTVVMESSTSPNYGHMRSPVSQRKSIYEEYPWLDNALSLLFDKLLRLFVVLVKKFIFKMDVTVADFF